MPDTSREGDATALTRRSITVNLYTGFAAHPPCKAYSKKSSRVLRKEAIFTFGEQNVREVTWHSAGTPECPRSQAFSSAARQDKHRRHSEFLEVADR